MSLQDTIVASLKREQSRHYAEAAQILSSSLERLVHGMLGDSFGNVAQGVEDGLTMADLEEES